MGAVSIGVSDEGTSEIPQARGLACGLGGFIHWLVGRDVMHEEHIVGQGSPNPAKPPAQDHQETMLRPGAELETDIVPTPQPPDMADISLGEGTAIDVARSVK